MIVYIKNLLKSIIGILLIISSYAQPKAGQLLIDRDIAEWCLENRATVKLLYKVIDNKDSISAVKTIRIKEDSVKIDSYERTVKYYSTQVDNYGTIIENNNTIIDKKDDKIKSLETNKWVERFLFVAGIVIAILI